MEGVRGPVRVLYVADGGSDAGLVGRLDADDEFVVVTAEGRADGLDLLDRRSFDCVVGDVADGIGLLSAVRGHRPDVPYVFVARERSACADEALAAGATDYFERRTGRDRRRLFAARVGNVATSDVEPAVGTDPRFEAAFEDPDTFVALLAPDGTLRSANATALSFIDGDVEEVVGRTFWTTDWWSHSDELQRRIRSGIEQAADGTFVRFEANYRNGDRGVVALDCVLRPVTVDGTVRAIVVEGRDVTQQNRIAAELRENETYLRKLYRTASNTEPPFEEKRRRLLELGRKRLGVDIGFVSRIDGNAFEVVDAVGSHELLRPGQTAPLSETYCRKILEDGFPEDSDGNLLTVQDAESEGWSDDRAYETYGLGCYVGAKVMVDGELYGTLCFADREPRERSFSETETVYVELISQWLSYEQEQLADERALREQNERLEEFASVVSHDLRNPLSIAEMYLEMAEDTGADEDFEQVREAHARMERLIRNLLTLARQGEALDEVADYDLSAVAEDAWENVETNGATYRTVDDPTVTADRERLQQLLENLFRNSVEHGSTNERPEDDAPEHGGEVITVGALDGDGFYVADDGPGIPETERDRIFDHGYSTGDGTGLGLAIVRRIAEAHDWSVSVGESESGGARFEFHTS